MRPEVSTTHQGAVMVLLLPALKGRASVAGQFR